MFQEGNVIPMILINILLVQVGVGDFFRIGIAKEGLRQEHVIRLLAVDQFGFEAQIVPLLGVFMAWECVIVSDQAYSVRRNP